MSDAVKYTLLLLTLAEFLHGLLVTLLHLLRITDCLFVDVHEVVVLVLVALCPLQLPGE